MGGNRISESKDIAVWNCLDLPFWISSISIHYGRPPDIHVKWYGRSNLPRASAFNLKRLDTLRASIVHSSQKIWTFEFAHSFHFQFQASQYIMDDNQPSESKDMDVWVCQRFNFQSQASRYIIGGNRISKSRYDRLDLPKSSVLNFRRLDTLLVAIGHPSQKIWPFEFN